MKVGVETGENELMVELFKAKGIEGGGGGRLIKLSEKE